MIPHYLLGTKRKFYSALLKHKLITLHEYHIKMGRLHNIPECCIKYFIDGFGGDYTNWDKVPQECPEDYIHCPACRAKLI